MAAALGSILLILIFFAIVYVAMAVKIVSPYQNGVIERLGKYKQTAGPGLRLIVPLVDKLRKVDMREQVIDVPPQEVITQDNVTAAVDAVVYFEATDPQRLLYNVSNFMLAVTKLAQTNLRNVVGEMTLDEAFTSRERVNTTLREILDEATDKWGVRVVRVEIQRIDPPADVMSAMHEQMKAERTRRAVVTQAEGTREAAITEAEGEKQSAILTAEGQRQRDILRAEGEAQSIRTRAEAEQFRQEVVAAGEANHQFRHGRPGDCHQVSRDTRSDRQRNSNQDLCACRHERHPRSHRRHCRNAPWRRRRFKRGSCRAAKSGRSSGPKVPAGPGSAPNHQGPAGTVAAAATSPSKLI